MAMNRAIDVTAAQRDELLSLLSSHLPNTEAWVYGSRIRWTSRPESDLDMVVFASPAQAHRVSALREALEESDLPFRVDLFVWNEIPTNFREQIEQERVVLTNTAVQAHRRRNRVALCNIVDLRLSSVDKKSKPNEIPIRLCNYTDVYYNTAIRKNMQFMEATASSREIAKCTLLSGDVVITKDSEKYDDIGVPAFVLHDVPGLVCGYHLAILRPDTTCVHGRYLFYVLSTPDAQTQFHHYANGITRFGLRKADIGLVEVPLPALREQRAIAYILGALDDKIDLNRRMNETLEAMARAIFKDWFVDFGPTRAKAEGRAPYLAPDLWGLFPDALDKERKPVGWVWGTLADIAKSPRRGVSPSDVSEDTPYIGLEHMPRRSIALAEWEGAGKVKSNKTQFHRGNILFGKLRPYFHKVGVAPLNGICSTDIVVVMPRSDEWGAFTLACLSSDEFVGYTDRTSTGTKMPRTSWKTMAQYQVCLPAEQIAIAYRSVVQPLLDQIATSIREVKILENTRDLLLPKLISGEVYLHQAKRAMDVVA